VKNVHIAKIRHQLSGHLSALPDQLQPTMFKIVSLCESHVGVKSMGTLTTFRDCVKITPAQDPILRKWRTFDIYHIQENTVSMKENAYDARVIKSQHALLDAYYHALRLLHVVSKCACCCSHVCSVESVCACVCVCVVWKRNLNLFVIRVLSVNMNHEHRSISMKFFPLNPTAAIIHCSLASCCCIVRCS